MHGWMNGWIDKRTRGWVDRRIGRWTDRWGYGLMDELMDGWTDQDR